MESSVSPTDQQIMVSTFLEIAVGQTAETARQFLQATSWKLEEAIQLFYVGSESGATSSSPLENERPGARQSLGGPQKNSGHVHGQLGNGNEVRDRIPVRREVLYDAAMFYGTPGRGNPSQGDEELERPGIWESDQTAASTTDNARDNLASLYRPPFSLMLQGPFEKAKVAAKAQDKWLLVNLQSTGEFSSHMLNRDTWANEAIAQTITSNFIFWQVYDDTEEGSKVCTYYKLDSIPVVLVIDPVTGQKIRSWSGMVEPETLLEDLLPFMDGSPKNHHANLSHRRSRETSQASPHKVQANEEDEELLQALAASMEGMNNNNASAVSSKDMVDVSNAEEEQTCETKKLVYPSLPEEPKGDKSLLCRVGVRFPDGRRIQRNFLRTDPIQLLWSFCDSQLEEADAKVIRLSQAIPGASKFLEYESNLTFDESGLSNSIVSVTLE